MTLITLNHDTELLLRQLRQRHTYLSNRIATLRPQENSDNFATAFTTTGALIELENERAFVAALISQIERGL